MAAGRFGDRGTRWLGLGCGTRRRHADSEQTTKHALILSVSFEGVDVERVIACVKKAFVDEALASAMLILEIHGGHWNSVFHEGANQWNKIAVASDERRNVNRALQSDLHCIDSESHVDALLLPGLR